MQLTTNTQQALAQHIIDRIDANGAGSIAVFSTTGAELAILGLSLPCAQVSVNGSDVRIVFNAISDEDACLADGQPSHAIVKDGIGEAILSMSCGPVINGTITEMPLPANLYTGNRVRVTSAHILM